MKTTTYRTTFSLDEATARRLSRLASAWRVSRAEVVRRAVALADRENGPATDAGDLLGKLHGAGRGLAREEAETYLAEVRTARTHWRSGS